MSDKSKTSPELPEVRLAKAFKFTGEDLAVNRSGYMSRRQEGSPDIDYAILSLLSRIFRGRIAKPKREFRRVISVCGRARLAHFVVDRPVHSGKGAGGFWEYFTLTFADEDVKFVISAKQYRTLAENLVYRVYYNPAKPDKILSIERPDGGCDKG